MQGVGERCVLESVEYGITKSPIELLLSDLRITDCFHMQCLAVNG